MGTQELLKIIAKISHSAENEPTPYLYTLRRTIAYAYTLPNAIAYLNTCITYLDTLTRLSAPYLNTCIAYLNTWSRLPILITCIPYPSRRLSDPYLNALNQHDSSRRPRAPSASNQNRLLRHPSCQPFIIEHYVTPELSARVEVPSRLSVRDDSL